MGCTCDSPARARTRTACLLVAACVSLIAGCNELEPIKRELLTKFTKLVKQKKSPFVPRDGITTRACSLFRTANQNSEIIRDLPAEAPIHLLDKIGDWYRVRTRDGKEGYVEQKVVGGQEIIQKIQELKRSIEGIRPQAEGTTKSRANFRLSPGREQEIVEVLQAGKKFEVYERVVTVRQGQRETASGIANAAASDTPSGDSTLEDFKKDVWYKVKIEDGRVGYLYTHNMVLTPPDEIARMVPFMRMVGWQTISMTDDPDRGAKNNYLVAYAPIGKDAGCDYTKLYLMTWSSRSKHHVITSQMKLSGILPITSFQHEGRPGFSVRYLHPTKKDKLIRADFVLFRGGMKKVNEEEIPDPSRIH